MGKIIAVEGIDGSGKNTQSNRILAEYSSINAKVSKISFPRYGETFFGKEVGNYLNGHFGSLDYVHPKFSAMLYAGDRFECKEEILIKSSDEGVVIFDRYVQSNVAHQLAKVPMVERAAFKNWIEDLEFGVYGLPKPDLIIFLDMPPSTSGNLVLKKDARIYTDKKKDLHEENDSYLEKVYDVFKEMSLTDQNWVTINCFENDILLNEDDVFSRIKDVLIANNMFD